MARAVRFVAWSDYLCPWCWVATQRLARLEREFAGRVQIEWRSYLLRPIARGPRDPERFRHYTESWRRPAAEPDVEGFRVWSSDEPPPTHSVPAHCAAKAAARVSPGAFRAMHERLMRAYFLENRDISSFEVLAALWGGLGLPPEGFAWARSEQATALVFREFEEGHAAGATGVPALRRIDNDAVVIGAQPEALYRRWIERSLQRDEGTVEVEG